MRGGRKIIDETGNRYGRLTVLHRDGTKSNSAAWLCSCICGSKVTISGWKLRYGKSKSCGCASILPLGVAAFHTLIRNTKRAAKERGYSWGLTKEEVRRITSGNCYYCDSLPKYKASRLTSNCRGEYLYNGIDRVDNTKGYILTNVVSCCYVCNIAKHTMSKSDFLCWVSRVYKNRVENGI